MNYLPVRNKYIAKSEVGNQLNIFVFESGDWINVGAEFMVWLELKELYVVVRSHGSDDFKRMKNAWANPNTMKNKITRNEKTVFATPIIIAK